MIGKSTGFTLPRDGAAFAGRYAVDSVPMLASTRLSMERAVLQTMRERQLMAALIEGATKA